VAVDDGQGVLRTVRGWIEQCIAQRVVEVVGPVAQPEHHARDRVRRAVDLPLGGRVVAVHGLIRVLEAAVEAAVVAPLGQVVQRVHLGERDEGPVALRRGPGSHAVLEVVREQLRVAVR